MAVACSTYSGVFRIRAGTQLGNVAWSCQVSSGECYVVVYSVWHTMCSVQCVVCITFVTVWSVELVEWTVQCGMCSV